MFLIKRFLIIRNNKERIMSEDMQQLKTSKHQRLLLYLSGLKSVSHFGLCMEFTRCDGIC